MIVDILREWEMQGKERGFYFRHPVKENAVGFYPCGFIQKNDSAVDFTGWYGMVLEVKCINAKAAGMEEGEACQDNVSAAVNAEHCGITVAFADKASLKADVPFLLQNEHAVIEVPFSVFPLETVAQNYWQFVTAIEIEWGKSDLCITAFRICRGRGIYLEMPIKGKSGETGEEIVYEGCLYNCEPTAMIAVLQQSFEGWESLRAEITMSSGEAQTQLPPYGSVSFEVKVKVHDYMVPGGHESTTVKVMGWNGQAAYQEQVILKTMRTLRHPYIYHNEDGWRGVMDKINKYSMYRPVFEDYVRTASQWQVTPPVEGRDFCYETKEEDNIMSAAYVYAMTGKKEYGEKIAQFFKYFADVEKGYPAKRKGCSQSYVQEGHFFQHLAIPYDVIYDAGVLSGEEKEAVEHCFRLYMDMLDNHLRSGHISNWLVSECMGAFYCALAIQDMDRVLRFVFGNGGLIEQLRHGIFNDGWWHECSIGYNTWVSSMMIHMAHALLPFGYNLLHTHFQLPFNKSVSSTYGGMEAVHSMGQRQEIKEPSGMCNQKWGGNLRSSVCIKDMFDATIPFLDHRGVLFGIADSDEKKLSGVHFGSTYDLAYTYYQDPEYIPVIKRITPDPIFGHPVLPEYAEKKGGKNACADNIGLAMLRNQKEGRERSEQIQAVLRYGSHGGAHGHFDITDLLSVMRYGRSFYNPENCWWGYAHFMYKFYVQCSLTKNMVVVDDKMQIPGDSRRILFYSGRKIQAAGVEVVTKWAYPPYGGMVYYQDGQTNTKEELRKRCRMNRCCLPIAEGERSPVYGEMSDYTEDILQRRVMVVTDDYIVIFDYLEGEKEHLFDSLMQIKGFQGIEGEHVKYLRHTEQMNDNPVSDAQFITDCNWYQVKGPASARFETVFTKEHAGERKHCDRSNYNEPGILKMDVHTAWPLDTEQMVGRVAVYDGWAADGNGYTIPLHYRMEGDGKVIAEGDFDGWILGRGEMDVSVEGIKEITLVLRQGSSQDEMGKPVRTPQACFWGSVILICRDGLRIDIGEKMRQDMAFAVCHNVDRGQGIGRDYQSGRVTIVGEEYTNAIPASPICHEEESRITIPLKDFTAVRLQACVGVDAFAGEEGQKRKTYAVRTSGYKARFVTVIEPYEKDAMIQHVVSDHEDHVKVCLWDGRQQTITLQGMETGSPGVDLKEVNAEGLICTEHAF